jgi:hypothetical protein
MTKGDVYSYAIELFSGIAVHAGHPGPNYAIARYSIGVAGGDTWLKAITIK